MAARKRHDPVSRPADGYQPLDKITNTQPGWDYVFVDPNNEASVDVYKADGYQFIERSPDGPRLLAGAGTAENSTHVERLGMRLMGCTPEAYAAKQARAEWPVEQFERKVVKTGGMPDGLRGMGYEISVDPKNTEPFARKGD